MIYDTLEHDDMMQLIVLSDKLGWDQDRLLRACHNLLLLDEDLDIAFERRAKLSVVRE